MWRWPRSAAVQAPRTACQAAAGHWLHGTLRPSARWQPVARVRVQQHSRCPPRLPLYAALVCIENISAPGGALQAWRAACMRRNCVPWRGPPSKLTVDVATNMRPSCGRPRTRTCAPLLRPTCRACLVWRPQPRGTTRRWLTSGAAAIQRSPLVCLYTHVPDRGTRIARLSRPTPRRRLDNSYRTHQHSRRAERPGSCGCPAAPRLAQLGIYGTA